MPRILATGNVNATEGQTNQKQNNTENINPSDHYSTPVYILLYAVAVAVQHIHSKHHKQDSSISHHLLIEMKVNSLDCILETLLLTAIY
jgi:hypothetical protein